MLSSPSCLLLEHIAVFGFSLLAADRVVAERILVAHHMAAVLVGSYLHMVGTGCHRLVLDAQAQGTVGDFVVSRHSIPICGRCRRLRS